VTPAKLSTTVQTQMENVYRIPPKLNDVMASDIRKISLHKLNEVKKVIFARLQ